MWSQFVTFRSKAAAWLIAGLGSFAALGVAFALGAFEAAGKQELPQISAGQTMEAGKWLIRPLKAWVTDQKIYGTTPKEGQKFLLFEVELTNRTIQSDSGYSNIFQLPSAVGAKAETPMVYLARDESSLPDLQPGMMEKVVYLWRMPADAIPKDNVEFAIEAWRFKLRNNLTGTPGWWNKDIAGSVALPLSAEQG